MRGGRQVWLAQRGPGDGQGVDRVGLASGAGAVAGAGHQFRRYPQHPFTGGEQRPFQPGRHVPAVLDRPYPLVAVLPTRPGHQLPVTRVARPDRALTLLAAYFVDRNCCVGVLVDIDSQRHHHGWRLLSAGKRGGTAGPAGGHTSVGAVEWGAATLLSSHAGRP